MPPFQCLFTTGDTHCLICQCRGASCICCQTALYTCRGSCYDCLAFSFLFFCCQRASPVLPESSSMGNPYSICSWTLSHHALMWSFTYWTCIICRQVLYPPAHSADRKAYTVKLLACFRRSCSTPPSPTSSHHVCLPICSVVYLLVVLSGTSHLLCPCHLIGQPIWLHQLALACFTRL